MPVKQKLPAIAYLLIFISAPGIDPTRNVGINNIITEWYTSMNTIKSWSLYLKPLQLVHKTSKGIIIVGWYKTAYLL